MVEQSADSLNTDRIREFFRDLDGKFEAAAQIDRYVASQFNVVKYWPEIKLSRVICDLLDPRGTHGQGHRFLRYFLKVIKRDREVTGAGFARCEEPTTKKRRIDILASPDGRLGIGIENKPWAGDQRGWVADYSAHLRNRFGTGNFVLVFLTTERRREPEAEEDRRNKGLLEANGEFCTITFFRKVKTWLKLCRTHCAADRVQRFLGDFIDYLPELEGTGMKSATEIALVSDYVSGIADKEHRDRALKIAYAAKEGWADIRDRILIAFRDRLEKQLWKQLRKDIWTIQKPKDPYNCTLKIFKPKWRDSDETYDVRLEPYHRDIGVWKNGHRSELPHVDGLKEYLDNAIEQIGRQSDWWEWHVTLDERYRNWDDPQTLIVLSDENSGALEYFQDLLSRLAEEAAKRIDLREKTIPQGQATL